ncbi:hypothetical protein [Methylobacterium dankookense]|uniref:Uncharacterized protein n=1 Tax=Methylobacterium dankookense TaxID=560405 RepID=A0A564G2B8_9HYPH|nr:hypothetical protein [Methylobacterium dankookense]GJD57766.1 hypothetical protein IFDJLNFL_3679 [Methylobacterium dankookense]VUF14098.1 hypothetical protein MTDSW087_03809 [Methylobacterium dankookense]
MPKRDPYRALAQGIEVALAGRHWQPTDRVTLTLTAAEWGLITDALRKAAKPYGQGLIDATLRSDAGDQGAPSEGGKRILDGLNDALAFAEGDTSRATVHLFDVKGGKATKIDLPTYTAVLERAELFPEGASASGLRSHFVREADQGSYNFDLIHAVEEEVARHLRNGLDRGDLRLVSGLRYQRAPHSPDPLR